MMVCNQKLYDSCMCTFFYSIAEKYSKLLQTNPKCLMLWNGDKEKKLNKKQKEAIEKALKNRFSLIQGPPGMIRTQIHKLHVLEL